MIHCTVALAATSPKKYQTKMIPFAQTCYRDYLYDILQLHQTVRGQTGCPDSGPCLAAAQNLLKEQEDASCLSPFQIIGSSTVCWNMYLGHQWQVLWRRGHH